MKIGLDWRIVRVVFVVVGVMGLSWVGTVPVEAGARHAIVLRSQPAEGSTQATGPQNICLWFSESAQPVGESISVLAPDGKSVETGKLHVRGAQFCVPISLHASGSYLVSWQVISLDTDPASGSFLFNLRHSGGQWATTTSSGTSPQGVVLQVLARLLHFLGYALSFGVLAFGWFVIQPLGVTIAEHIRHRQERLVMIGIGVLLVAEPLALLAQTVSLGKGDVGNIIGAILASSFGRVLAQRLGVALLLWIILGMVRESKETRASRIGILGLGLLLAFVDGEASHAVSKEPVWLGLLANMVHVAAMGLWVGGMIGLLALWGEKEPGERRAEIVVRFGQLATIAVSELVISGLLMAWLRLNQPLNLFTSVYGRVLLGKICLLPLVLLLAWVGRRVKWREQVIWWRIEGLGLLGLLVLAGLLVALPPPL
ncbi:MAG TPA: copper resistance protein CopC [Ktedonobacteraceae bacterium]|nr:copper resistance protein CopC [Ktedonobacteraceae bacterium]